MVCGQEKVQLCIPILSTWLADHMENINIHCIKVNRCPICMASRDQLGLLPKRPYAQRDDTHYGHLLAASDNDAFVTLPLEIFGGLIVNDRLTDLDVKPIQNALWSLPS